MLAAFGIVVVDIVVCLNASFNDVVGIPLLVIVTVVPLVAVIVMVTVVVTVLVIVVIVVAGTEMLVLLLTFLGLLTVAFFFFLEAGFVRVFLDPRLLRVFFRGTTARFVDFVLFVFRFFFFFDRLLILFSFFSADGALVFWDNVFAIFVFVESIVGVSV